jgi:RHS repeat-associated protein
VSARRSLLLARRAIILLISVILVTLGLPSLPWVPDLSEPALALITDPTSRISVTSSGGQATGGDSQSTWGDQAISSSGQIVAFASSATNLVTGDTNATRDIFVRDTTLNLTTRVSVDSSGVQANGWSDAVAVSADGRYVAFDSSASNLVTGDTNAASDIFVHDRATGTTSRVSVDSSGAQANSASTFPAVSSDGRYVAFHSSATNLVTGDTNIRSDVFIRDRTAGTTTRLSVDSSGAQATNGDSQYASISGDGRYVAFESGAINLVPGDTNLFSDVFIRDRTAGTTTRVSVDSSGAQGNNASIQSSVSADGRYVAFQSKSSNLVTGDTNGKYDIFVRDRTAATTTRVSVDSSGAQADKQSLDCAISGDGRYVAFTSEATNLVPNDTNLRQDIFLRDRTAGSTERISVSSSGAQASDGSWSSATSGGGRFVVYSSYATDLVSDDTNLKADVFIRDRNLAFTVPAAQTYGRFGFHAENPTGFQSDPVNSATGSFSTAATDVSLPGIGLPFVFTRSYNSTDSTSGPLGPGWTHSYAVTLTIQGGTATLRGEDGQQVVYTQQPDGSFLGAAGARSTLSSIAGGYELLRTDQVTYTFDTQGRLTQLKDRNNRTLTLAYNVDGKLATLTDTVGRIITFTHNGSGLLTGISMADGRTVGFAYTSGRLTTVTDVRTGTITYEYDGSGRLTNIKDQNNHYVVRNTYGGDGRVTQQLDPLGNQSTFSWNPTTQTSTMTDARNNQWKDVYSGNVLIKRIDPLNNTTTYDYDESLNQTRVTDPRGNTTGMTYDIGGNLVHRSAPAPLNYQEWFSYDAKNNLVSHLNGRGNAANYGYDTAGNLTSMTQPGNILTQYGRDSGGTGLLVSLTDPRSKVTTFEYDTVGNRNKVTTPLGFITTMGYDSAGRMTSLVEPRGNVQGGNPELYRWTYTYDAAGNRLTESDPLGNVVTWTYDPIGNVASRKDQNDRTTSYAYNAADELTSVTAPGSIVTSYGYDTVGNLITRTDPKFHATTYAYDSANRLTSVTSPTSQLWTYEYDAAGNRTKMVDAIGNSTSGDPNDGTTTYGYDALNRLTSINYSDSTPDSTFAYDASSNRTSMVDGSGTETYSYDSLDRLTGVTRGSANFVYQYDAASNLTQRTYPDGTVVDYAYDNDSRMSSVTTGGNSTSYTYDAADNLVQTTLPSGNGYIETRTYDRAARITEVKNAKSGITLSNFTYTLDPVGNPTAVTTVGGSVTYVYDSLNRLTEACYQASCPGQSDPFVRYAYDDVGNWTTETRPAGATTFVYNNADQLTTKTGPGGTVNYTYDQNGNQTAAGSRTFTYDMANRMASTTSGGSTINYTYDGEGKRLQGSTGAQPSNKRNYLWDRNAELPLLIREADGNDALIRRFVYGIELISMTTGGSDFYYHHDRLGSTANLTSSTGSAQWTYSFEPFGSIRTSVQNDQNAPTNLMRFTGELLDTTPGLYHLRARQYDPATGRFLQRDPFDGTIRDSYVGTYVYSRNQPTVAVDPSGLWCLIHNSDGGCLGGGVVRAAGDFVYEYRWEIGTFLVGAGCTVVSAGACTVLIGSYLTAQTVDLTAQYDFELSPRLMLDVTCNSLKTVLVRPAWAAVASPISWYSRPGCFAPPADYSAMQGKRDK